MIVLLTLIDCERGETQTGPTAKIYKMGNSGGASTVQTLIHARDCAAALHIVYALGSIISRGPHCTRLCMQGNPLSLCYCMHYAIHHCSSLSFSM